MRVKTKVPEGLMPFFLTSFGYLTFASE